MPGPERPTVNPAVFYGAILGATVEHMTTARLWETIRTQADAMGVAFPSDVLQQVNQLRANAGQVVAASERLTGASTPTTITSEVMGRPIYARPLADQEARPMYEARFQVDTLGLHGVESSWYRLTYGTDVPETIAGLREDVSMYAADFAGAYGQELIGVGTLMLNVL